VTPSWLHIQVELDGGAGIVCDPPPGRVFVVGPHHTFLHFADAIDDAFARWDAAHLHAFELTDGRLIGLPDPPPRRRLGGPRWLDHRRVRVTRELVPGEPFSYTFDLAAEWHHRCIVLGETADPLTAYGVRPQRPAIVSGWGWIPDQYGRTSPEQPELGA
jgi:hypothetical protein